MPRQFALRLAESCFTFYNSMWEQSRNISKQSAAEQPPDQNTFGRGRRKRMKFRNVGQVLLTLVVSVGLSIGVTSCTNSYTVGYLYVVGSQYNQISGFNINNQTGKLTPVQKSPFGTGGSNPVRALVLSGGRFLYVLNHGDPSTGTASNVSLFEIGGDGVLTFQASYFSQGNQSISMTTDSAGAHLYVLDEYSPATTTPCTSGGVSYPTGDISAYSIDPNTGRLALVTNAQVANPDGTQLTYFPLGCFPVEFKLVGGFIFTAQTGSTGNNDVQTVFAYSQSASNGQLTLTQNAPLQTGATAITYINTDPAGRYVYLLDAGPSPASNGCTGGQTAILPYTIGSGGILQSLVGGVVCNDPTAVGPTVLLVDSKTKFLYVANASNTNLNQPASEISAFTIDPTTGKLAFIAGQPFGTGSGPRCMLEDPTNQFIYTANFNDSTVTGKIIDVNAGVLNPLRVSGSSFTTSGNPTWCAVTGRTQ
jgi:6-phosphogluconolactonase (cycloisomerase 2 family)